MKSSFLSLLVAGSLLTLATLPGVCAAPAKPTSAPSRKDVEAVQTTGRYLATITMDTGKSIELVLEGSEMPYTVANFLQLAKAGFYNGLTYHRVEKDPQPFVIQGGDPNGDGSGSPGYMLNLEISPFLRHKKGALSMARTNRPDTAGCQFFITLADTPFLDGQYAVFGWVKSGQEVVDSVKAGDKMKSVTVEPYKGKEPCPLEVKSK
jgi:peptidyl-prolyl cis-trans isomerase B (cyclophilin B)